MKTKLLFFTFLFITGIVFAGCNQKNQYRPDAKVITEFNAKYPQAARVEWEAQKGYQSAEFRNNGTESEAWFENSGKWLMTKTELKYSALPTEVRNQLEKSTYAGWKKEEVHKIERDGMAPVYIIDLEKGEQETNLYYAENGTLVKTINDAQKEKRNNFMPVSPTLKDKISLKYPGATIIETDTGNGLLEVDIIDKGQIKELTFNDDLWVSTSWAVNKTDVPQNVIDALRKSSYSNYRIEDIHYVETPDHSYYLFDLEQGDKDTHLSIDPSGNILP